MRVEYEPKHDIMNIEFIEGAQISESLEIEGIIFDYNEERKIISIEILDVSKRISRKPFETIDFVIVPEKITV